MISGRSERIGMKTVISVATAFACAFSLHAQITTRLNHLPDGSDEVRIRNNSATSLVASVVAGKRVIPGPSGPGDLLRGVDRTADAAATVRLLSCIPIR